MKLATFFGGVSIAVGVFASRPAHADYACPATTDAYNENLYLYGFDSAYLTSCSNCGVTLGNVDFYGTTILAGCVTCTGLGCPNLNYAITDHNNNLLNSLPKSMNHLCNLNTSGSTYVDVTSSNTSCNGVTFYPLTYNGNNLAIYMGGGNDHVDGGSGQDELYGGSGVDDLDEGGYNASCAYGENWGENDNDFLHGACGNTFHAAGAGNDEIADTGGTADYYYGQDGNECCIRDGGQNGGDTWNVMNGGAGTNKCGSNGATSCPYDSTCDHLDLCCHQCLQ